MSAIATVEIEKGKVKDKYRKYLGQIVSTLEDGEYKIGFEKKGKRSNATRYKFYFDCIMAFALPKASKVYQILKKGHPEPISTTGELHFVMKVLFNPVSIIDQQSGEVITNGASTVTMSDKEFIGEFSEQVIAHFASEPFFIEFPTFEEWGQLYREGLWHDLKSNIAKAG